MGLQGQLNDLSSDSIPIFLLAVVATLYSHLRSSLLSFFHSLGLCRGGHALLIDAVGSGLAVQLSLNRLLSYRYDHSCHRDGAVDPDCIVCLSSLRDGERVRMLQCRHVFHKGCFDGWLDQLNFTCPICRSSIVANEERVCHTRCRVGALMLSSFFFFFLEKLMLSS